MKKLLLTIAAVSTLLVGCAQQEDQTTAPADTTVTTTNETGTSTNQ